MRRPSFSNGLQLMLSPQALVPFLIGSLAIAILGSAAYQLLTNWLGATNRGALMIGAGALLVLVFTAWFLSTLVERLSKPEPLLGKRHPDKRRGVIVLVSSEPSCRAALQWHGATLERCWLFCSTQSAPIAAKLEAEMKAAGKSVTIVHINDVFDPLEYRDAVERIYASLPEGWSDNDVIVDFTGMTSCGSVGSVLAAVHAERPIQYTPAQFDGTLTAMRALDPVEITIDWHPGEPPAAETG